MHAYNSLLQNASRCIYRRERRPHATHLNSNLHLLRSRLQHNRLANFSRNIRVFQCYRNYLVLFDTIVCELYPAFHNRENSVVASHHGVLSMVILLPTLSNYYVTRCDILPTKFLNAQSTPSRVSSVLTGTTCLLGGKSNGLKIAAHFINTSTNLSNTTGHR